MTEYQGLFSSPFSGKVDLRPELCASSLLDGFWADEAFGAPGQSQVVPDAIELDLEGVAAGLEQHFHADSPPAHWAPCPDCRTEFGSLLQQCSCSTDRAGSKHADPILEQQHLISTDSYQHQQQLLQHSNIQPQQQHSPQQRVPDLLLAATTPQDPAVAAAAAAFTWPCPQELKRPLGTSAFTATSMVPLDTPAARSVSLTAPDSPAAVPSYTSCDSDSSLPDAASAQAGAALGYAFVSSAAVAAESAGSAAAEATAAAAAAAAVAAEAQALPRRRGVSAGAGSSYSRQQQLGPPVRSRAEAVTRYKAKRARRSTAKKVRYQRRKEYADQRPRVGGRFIKKCELQQ